MSILSCGNCGGALKEQNIKGERFALREYRAVTLLTDFTTKKCSSCGELFLRGRDLSTLNEALEESIKALTVESVGVLKDHTNEPQKKIAALVGLSPEYLSELLSKRKVPSLIVFNLFKVLSKFPTAYECLRTFEGNAFSGFIGPATDRFKFLTTKDREATPASSKLKKLRFGSVL